MLTYANMDRTFLKWEHISILLATLALTLYNSAGGSNAVASSLAVIYTLIAVFSAGWGWMMYLWRSDMIRGRSGRDFDNISGPIVVCLALLIALCLNFSFQLGVALGDATLSGGRVKITLK